jgi:flagellar P-ring protein precursor FlgI
VLYISAMRIICFLLALCIALPASASVRIKDIVHFEGVRDNLLVGYGLVVGLNGTGDKLNNTAFTEQSLKAFLERLGVNSSASQLKTKNIAAVTVTAQLPAFARNGGTIDVSVSTIGDAKSLQGGVLLATPLLGADGEVYAVAQGSVSSGTVAAGAGASVTKGVPTSGTIAGGAIVEREIDFKLNAMNTMNISLKNPDFTTASRVSSVINGKLGKEYASVLDPATIQLNIPEANTGKVANLIGELESLTLETDQPAKIVIDEASGTIVMGENVRIDTVAIAQGNLVVKVEETPQVSQPGLLAPEGAQTVVTPQTKVNVEEDKGKKSIVMQKGATLNDLVKGLNSLGVGPRDLIAILQSIKSAGALQAEIETR